MKLVRIATPGMSGECARSVSGNVTRRSALHPLQDRRAGMLERHVYVFDEVAVPGDRIEKSLRDFVRVRIQKTNPFRRRRLICARRASNCAKPSFRPKSSP